MSKLKAGLIIALAFVAIAGLATVLFLRSEFIDISADGQVEDTPTDETDNARILSVDDGVNQVAAGQTLTYGIKVDYRELAKKALGKTTITNDELIAWLKSQRSDSADRKVYVMRGWLGYGRNASTNASSMQTSNFATLLPVPVADAKEITFEVSSTIPTDITGLKPQIYGTVRLVEVQFDCNNRWGLPNWSPGRTCTRKSTTILEAIKHTDRLTGVTTPVVTPETDIKINALIANPNSIEVTANPKNMVLRASLSNLTTVDAADVKVKFSVPTGYFQLVNTSSGVVPMETADGKDYYTVPYGTLDGGEVVSAEVKEVKLILKPIKADQDLNKLNVTATAITTTKETVIENNVDSINVVLLKPF